MQNSTPWQPTTRHQKFEKLVRFESIAFSPDAKNIAVVDNASVGSPNRKAAGGIWLYKRGKRAPFKLIERPEGQNYKSILFSPDGKHLIAKRDAHFFNHKHRSEFVYFDTATWKPVRVIEFDNTVQAMLLLPKRKQFLATDCYGTFTLFDLKTGKQKISHTYGHIEARNFAASTTEKTLAFQSAEEMRLINLDSGKEVWRTKLKKPTHMSGRGTCVFSPNDKQLAVGLGNAIAVLDASNGRVLRYLRCKGNFVICGAAYSPDGKFLLAGEHFGGSWRPGDQCGLRIWHPETGVEIRTFSPPPPFHQQDWEVMEYWPDANTLALIGQMGDTLTEIDLTGLENLVVPPPPAPIVPRPDLLLSTDEGKSRLQAVLDDPENLTPRRDAARWLAKNGDPQRGEFILKQCAGKPEDLAQADDILVAWFDSWTAPVADFKLSADAFEFRNGFPFSLALTGNDVTDAVLKSLAEFPTLEYLDLQSTSISNPGLKVLRFLPNLRELNVQGTAVTKQALQHLVNHEHFQHLQHDWRDSKSLQAVQNLYEARNQRFLRRDAKTQQREALQFFMRRHSYPELKPGSTKAHLSQSGMTDADLCYLTAFPKIHTVDLFECPLTGSGLHYLSSLPIRSLSLRDTDVWNLKPLAQLTQLEELQLADDFDKFDFSSLSFLQNLPLKSLTFWGTNLTDREIPYLLKLVSLEKLDIQGCDVSESGIAQLKAGLPKLVAKYFKHDWK